MIQTLALVGFVVVGAHNRLVASTPSLLQLTLTNETEVGSPFEDTIELTTIGDLPQNTEVNVNISGKIANIYKDREDTNNKTVIVLRDEDISIKL